MMKSKFRFLALITALIVSGFAVAGEKTIDWVALNGNSAANIFGEGGDYGVETNGVWYYTVVRIHAETSVDAGRFKTVYRYVNNSGWFGVCYNFTNACNLTFGEAQQIVVPYEYVSSGSGEVGQYFRLIIGTTTGNKYFGVTSQETVAKGEGNVFTFNISDAYSAYPTDYAAVKDSQINIVRLYPYNTGDGVTTSATAGSGGRQRFVADDELYIGAFTSKWTDVTGYTASFNANGGDAVADITTDTEGAFTFPTATRTDWTFMGWYRDWTSFAAGDAGVLVMDSTFAAAWRKTDPTVGLSSTSVSYRKELDVYKAYGSCCQVLVGNDISYDPVSDVCRCIRTNVFELDAEPTVTGSATNVLLSGKSGNAGNNSPELILPNVGLTVKDIHDVTVRYRTTSTKLAGLTMTLKYWIGSTQYSVTSEDTMQVSEGDEFHTVTFKLAAALGETNYAKLKDTAITAWRLHPYVGSTMAFSNGVTLELGSIILDAEHSNGLIIFCR